ncbi:MAG: HD domain-containing protein [Gemmatimonadetes bacterium]|nr:HD domain-containing protein [Gemmatimonadota bacterium]NNM03559.1 HD domain-containing protein [Gemmatimonadota bacterium]
MRLSFPYRTLIISSFAAANFLGAGEEASAQGSDVIPHLISEMEAVFGETSRMVDHTMTVLGHALEISSEEGGDALVVRASAILHDIGIPRAREVHGSSSGQYQEVEGPPIARDILNKHGVAPEAVDHICGIVANHHTAHDAEIIETVEFQILWEADWLVNFPGRHRDKSVAEKEAAIEEIFRTKKGKLLARQMFLQ